MFIKRNFKSSFLYDLLLQHIQKKAAEWEVKMEVLAGNIYLLLIEKNLNENLLFCDNICNTTSQS